jgi:ribosomal protein L3
VGGEKIMKVFINENETYQIDVPNEILAKDFVELLSKFDNIMKIIKLNVAKNEVEVETDRHNLPNRLAYMKRRCSAGEKSNSRTWVNTREKALDLLQYAYHGTKEDRQRISKLVNVPWLTISKGFHGLMQRYNIQADEIGLMILGSQFARATLMPSYIIKSHTGYFDENGNH